jgi:hypothetical protein
VRGRGVRGGEREKREGGERGRRERERGRERGRGREKKNIMLTYL